MKVLSCLLLLLLFSISFSALSAALLLISSSLLLSSAAFAEVEGFCSDSKMAATLGGLKHSQSPEIDNLARFAIQQHNQKQNASLELARVVKAEEQLVAGTLHHLTLEVLESGKKKLYHAKILVKPWLDFKELQDFRHLGDVPAFTPSDLGANKGSGESGWQSVPVHDPVVQDAANHAVSTIQQRSNSLLPYVLQEIVHAKAEVVEESAKFELLLKVSRGEKHEKFKVEVHKNNEGGFHLNHMEPDHS